MSKAKSYCVAVCVSFRFGHLNILTQRFCADIDRSGIGECESGIQTGRQAHGLKLKLFSDLKQRYPERAATIDESLDNLTVTWNNLEAQSNDKEKELFNKHKNEILEKSAADLETFISDVESKVARSADIENPKDLATCNRLLLDQQRLEDQLDNRKVELESILKDADNSMQPRLEKLGERFDDLLEPLADRRSRIQTAKQFHQLKRNLQDQIIWVDERLPRAISSDYGNSLHQVQKLLKRNQNLSMEIDSAQARVDGLYEQVDKLCGKSETTPEQSAQINKLAESLREKWSELKVPRSLLNKTLTSLF